MPDYQKLYFNLFNRVTDAIEAFQKAQREAEEEFIASDDAPILQIAPEEVE
jgi:hypothetical protein